MNDLSRDGLMVLAWILTGSAVLLTVGRYAIRLETIKTLKADDYVHGLALLVLIGYVSTYTSLFPVKSAVEAWTVGSGKRPSDADLRRYFHLEIAVLLLYRVVIYLVKFAFLLFYRLLFGVSRTFMRAGWIVCAMTVLTFLISFTSVFWACETPRYLFILEHCLSRRALDTRKNITSVWCGLNVASDLSIIILPLWMLQGLQMSTSRKVGLAVLFSIAISDVIFDITRTIYSVKGGAFALDTVWDILEPTVAVIVSTLPSYKALLGIAKKKKITSYQNLNHSAGDTGHSKQSHRIDPSGSGVELRTHYTHI